MYVLVSDWITAGLVFMTFDWLGFVVANQITEILVRL